MKTTFIIFAFVLLAATAFAVDASLQFFNAKSTGTSVTLEWKSSAEGDLERYEVERAGEDQIFRHVAAVQAKGSNQLYTYNDEEAFGKRDATDQITKNYFTYRLRLVHTDKSVVYSSTSGVTHNVSSIRRTWGMIKEMFR